MSDLYYGKMFNTMKYQIITLALLLASHLHLSVTFWLESSKSLRIFRRHINQREIHIYLYNRVSINFVDTQSWCSRLGGKLPTIHSREDLNFLVDTIMVPDSQANGHITAWLGMKRNNNTCEWTDGTVVDYPLPWKNETCNACRRNCCATEIINERWYKKVHNWSCTRNHGRQICVIKTTPDDVTSSLRSIANFHMGRKLTPSEFRQFLIETDPTNHLSYAVMETQVEEINQQIAEINKRTLQLEIELKSQKQQPAFNTSPQVQSNGSSQMANYMLCGIAIILFVLVLRMLKKGKLHTDPEHDATPRFRDAAVRYNPNSLHNCDVVNGGCQLTADRQETHTVPPLYSIASHSYQSQRGDFDKI